MVRRDAGKHDGAAPAPIALLDVRDIRAAAERIVASFEGDCSMLLANCEVHHIGATALPFGHTKGDVDVNVRVEEAQFPALVAALGERFVPAQEQNWTRTFASFSTGRYALPLGIQVTVVGSRDDFLLALRDRMRADAPLLRRYDELKLAAAAKGADAYWEAKNTLLGELIAHEGV